MAVEFGAKRGVINPCYSPSRILRRHGLPKTILGSYADMKLSETTKFFISSNDEVIDFSPIRAVLVKRDTSWFEGTSHRFNGPEFEAVVDYVMDLYWIWDKADQVKDGYMQGHRPLCLLRWMTSRKS